MEDGVANIVSYFKIYISLLLFFYVRYNETKKKKNTTIQGREGEDKKKRKKKLQTSFLYISHVSRHLSLHLARPYINKYRVSPRPARDEKYGVWRMQISFFPP